MNVDIETIKAAHERIAPYIVHTPLLNNIFLDERLNSRVLIKAECLQYAGAFKYRGAFNRLFQLSDEEKQRGVVAFSSGNHAQGVALAAKNLGISATIVMPNDAPQVKLSRTRAYGADVRLYSRQTESREAIAQEISEASGATVIPSFDDCHIISGQGTCGLEIVEQCQKQLRAPDVLLSPCGGGGLIAGVSIAIKAQWSDAHVYAVEPEGFDDYGRSLRSGKRERNAMAGGSSCDSLQAPSPGELTWAINQHTLSGGLVVTDDEAAHAVSFAWHYLKLVVEPGGAVALAALLNNKIDVSGKTVALILSGGNVDVEIFKSCLDRHPEP